MSFGICWNRHQLKERDIPDILNSVILYTTYSNFTETQRKHSTFWWISLIQGRLLLLLHHFPLTRQSRWLSLHIHFTWRFSPCHVILFLDYSGIDVRQKRHGFKRKGSIRGSDNEAKNDLTIQQHPVPALKDSSYIRIKTDIHQNWRRLKGMRWNVCSGVSFYSQSQ